jgi:hypothetical protein
VLEAGLVRDARDVDLGLIFGIGFPPFRGGLLFWADNLGADKIVEMLKPFEPLGPRFEPNAHVVGDGGERREVLSAIGPRRRSTKSQGQ